MGRYCISSSFDCTDSWSRNLVTARWKPARCEVSRRPSGRTAEATTRSCWVHRQTRGVTRYYKGAGMTPVRIQLSRRNIHIKKFQRVAVEWTDTAPFETRPASLENCGPQLLDETGFASNGAMYVDVMGTVWGKEWFYFSNLVFCWFFFPFRTGVDERNMSCYAEKGDEQKKVEVKKSKKS